MPSAERARPSGGAPGGRLPYRADIEGLRAVAIALVVLYHAGWRGARAGFLGVDVFFVLSGFLITGLLLDEIAATGRVSLTKFWARRARRLLPAAALVTLVVLIAERRLALAVRPAHLRRHGARLRRLRVEHPVRLAEHRLLRRRRRSRSTAAHLVALRRGAVLSLLRAGDAGRRALDARSAGRSVARRRFRHRRGRRHADLPRGLRGPGASLSGHRVLRAARSRVGVRSRCARGARRAARRQALVASSLDLLALVGIVRDRRVVGALPRRRADPRRAHARPHARHRRGDPLRCVAAIGRSSAAHCSLSPDAAHRATVVLVVSLALARARLSARARRRSARTRLSVGVAVLSLVPAAIAYRLVESPIRFSSALARRPRQVVVGALALAVFTIGASLAAARYASWTLGRPKYASILAARAKGRTYADGCQVPAARRRVARVPLRAGRATTPRSCCSATRTPRSGFPALDSVASMRGWSLVNLTKTGCPSVLVGVPNVKLGRRYTECERWREYADPTDHRAQAARSSW